MLGVLAVTGVAETWHVYVLAFVFGIGSAFDAPARQSFVCEMVARTTSPTRSASTPRRSTPPAWSGPAVAGLLIAGLGGGVQATGWVILLNARDATAR